MTIRAVLAIATKQGCKMKAGDIETAFLTADMDCEVWVQMPPFWGPGDTPISFSSTRQPPRRLLKGVPGIPQGSRLFHQTLSDYLGTTAAADQCLFLKPDPEFTAVLTWVDDFIFIHKEEQTWTAFIQNLRKRFVVPTVGDLTCFLGMSITYDPAQRSMSMSQTHTIKTLLERASMMDCNPVITPCVPGMVWTNRDCPSTDEASNSTQYRGLVALANFIANWTRPDITYTVNKLCKYMAKPGAVHWQALKHLLRYLKGSEHVGLYFNFDTPVAGLHGYTDASHADTGKSTMGYIFFYGRAALSWYSKLHTYVTTCTNHSEYAALALGAKEAQWMVYLFNELEPLCTHAPVPLFVDNSGVIALVDHQADWPVTSRVSSPRRS